MSNVAVIVTAEIPAFAALEAGDMVRDHAALLVGGGAHGRIRLAAGDDRAGRTFPAAEGLRSPAPRRQR